jgi:hypothetical protein
MLIIQNILAFFKGLTLTKVLFVALLLSLVVMLYYCDRSNKNSDEVTRLNSNSANINKPVSRELNLTKPEYDSIVAPWKDRLDSVKKVNDIKQKQIKSGDIIDQSYKDTLRVIPVHEPPIVQPDRSYIIKVSQDSACWSMKGLILSKDSASKFEITERKANNSIQRIDILPKRFLGFLWITRKANVKVFTDCGVVDFTRVNFKK